MVDCFICGLEASESCGECGTNFCCFEHGALHCNKVTGVCHPYEIKFTPDVGRYVVASRDIKQGEIIFTENAPLVVGPNQECPALCLVCLGPGDVEVICEGCGWPMCSSECAEEHRYSQECSLLSSVPAPEFQDSETISEAYHPILPLRLLLKKKDFPAVNRLAELFMDHKEDRKTSQYWPYCQEKVVPFIRSICPEFSDEEINRAIGLLEVNCYEVKNYVTFGVRGFFPLASLLSHSCIANCRTIWQTEAPFGNKTYAVTDIKKGEEIFTSYLRSSLCSLIRRKSIKESWYFDCKCRRCCDKTELGTHCNTLKCNKCGDGNLMVVSAFEYDSNWECDQCGHQESMEAVLVIVEKFNNEVKSLCENDRYNIDDWLELLSRTKLQFHPQHMVMIEIAKWLVPILCRGPSLSFPDFPMELVTIKLELATNYLKVLNIVEPGLSKFRAKFMFEMVDTKIFLFSEEMRQTGKSSYDILEFIDRLDQVLEIFNVLEPVSSYEKMIQMKSAQLRKMCKEMSEFILPTRKL